jgi:hypothetical protein
MFARIVLFIKQYDIMVSSSESFIWIDLAHAQACIWQNKSQLSLDDLLFLKALVFFFAYINFFVASMIMTVTALSIVASQSFASLHLYWEGLLLVHPTPENQVIPKSPL